MKLLILNGPNLNLLGLREPEVYGRRTYDDLCKLIRDHAAALGVEAEVRQTNHEGVLVDWIQEARGKFAGIVLHLVGHAHDSFLRTEAEEPGLGALHDLNGDVLALQPQLLQSEGDGLVFRLRGLF